MFQSVTPLSKCVSIIGRLLFWPPNLCYLVLTAIVLMLHICNNICAIYTTTLTKPLMCVLWPSGRGDGRQPNWHGFKPSSWRIDSSYWLLARWRASSFYRQQGTAPWMIDMSQHPWRGTVLAVATAVARQWGRSMYRHRKLDSRAL